MHIYIKQMVDFTPTHNNLKSLNLNAKQQKYFRSVIYSIVFHKIVNEILNALYEDSLKAHFVKQVMQSDNSEEIQSFLNSKIDNHRHLIESVGEKSQLEVFEEVLLVN